MQPDRRACWSPEIFSGIVVNMNGGEKKRSRIVEGHLFTVAGTALVGKILASTLLIPFTPYFSTGQQVFAPGTIYHWEVSLENYRNTLYQHCHQCKLRHVKVHPCCLRSRTSALYQRCSCHWWPPNESYLQKALCGSRVTGYALSAGHDACHRSSLRCSGAHVATLSRSCKRHIASNEYYQ